LGFFICDEEKKFRNIDTRGPEPFVHQPENDEPARVDYPESDEPPAGEVLRREELRRDVEAAASPGANRTAYIRHKCRKTSLKLP
jgi:hypothetical protein